MSASMSTEDNAEPNMTPILDMVFQLITFFMLVINLKDQSIDRELKLPVVGSARIIDQKGREDLLLLNVNTAGELMVYGRKREIEQYIALEARASLKYAKQTNPKHDAVKDELPTTIVIRADANVQYEKLDRIIKECQKHNFVKFQFRGKGREATGAKNGKA